MARAIGIDLGTTNCCVAVVDGDIPKVIRSRKGYNTMPSVLAIAENGKRLIGHDAKRQAITNARHTVASAKRLMGRRWDSPQVQQIMQNVSYELVPGSNNDVCIMLRGTSYSISEISAMILAEMRQIAEEYLNESITHAVVTVPAYFSDAARQATRDAGTIAGLNVMRIINEPTAAALAYGLGNDRNKLIVVYDLGGGTFDVSILEVSDQGLFKVIATAGNTFLGGEDFDARLVDSLVQHFEQEHGVVLRNDPMALQRLKNAAENAKCDLSSVGQVDVNLPFIACDDHNEALHLHDSIRREQLETMCQDLVQQTIDICKQTLSDGGLSVDKIDDVILVGGMTRMPLVQRSVVELFKREPTKSVHPDEVVALGAAVQGASLIQNGNETILLDVTPRSLGIMTLGSFFEVVIPQNTNVPTSKTKVFTTSRDNQTAVKILVMQGENAKAQHNELLGEFVLNGLRRAPKGQVEIEVSFEIDADGIINVAAKDLDTGKRQSIQVNSKSGFSKERLAELIVSASKHTLECQQNERLEQASQQAQALIDEIDLLLPRVQSIIGNSDFGRNSMDRARQVVVQTKASIALADVDSIRKQVEVLTRSVKMFRGLVQDEAEQ